MVQLEAANIKFRAGSGTGSRNSSSADQQRLDRSQRTHIAFGSRVAIPKRASRSGSQPVGIERQTSSASLSSSSGLALNMSHSDLNESTSSIPQVEVQKPILQPRPPKPASGKAVRRPNPRIRSAESASLVKRAKLKIEADGTGDESRTDQSEVIDKSTAKNRISDDADRETDKTPHGKLDENNNANVLNEKKNVDTTVRSMSQKMIGMRMGSQEDEDEYFRTRHDSESHEETSRSKDGSFSSTAESDAFFLYSSRPRSITNSSRSRLNSDSNSKSNGVPDVVVEKISPSEVNVFASLESDFHKESSDSEGEDPITRMHKLGGNRRNSPSPILVDRQGENGKERIRGSLMKEISPPAANRYDHLKYQSVQSDSMSWMYDSDSSQVVSHNISDHSFKQQSSPIKVDNDKSPRIARLRVLDAFSVSNEHGSDSEDILSDDSDATSYSTWKEPPPHIRNYRYQEEMRGVGMTLDLSTTLPMTPYIEEQSPIKEKTFDHVDGELSFTESEKMDLTKSQDMEGDDHSFKQQSSPIKVDNDKSPRIARLRVLDAFSVSNEHGSDSEDILSDDSDATSYSTWKEPPPHIRNYRYQEEMRGVGMTLDLSTTLPMTPYIEEQSPIKEKTFDHVDGELSFTESEKMDLTKSQDMEGELDLLYDPVLNCYYDPKTHKYYELA
eukprot:gene11392-21590_t